MLYALPEDQIAIRDMARDFASQRIAPHALDWDRDKHFPVDVFREAAALGMGGIYIRDDAGGSGLGRLDAVLIFEEDTPIDVIMELKPDVIVKGADYTEDTVVGGSFVRSNGGRVVLAPFEAGHSTTSAIARAGHGLSSKAKTD